jgi:hypothetical protein
MKQLLSLFFFLLPCLALAQYPSNGNQKITLGEQSTADGLIYRGVAATDTVRKPSIDTMAYMVLDTTTNIIWHYKKATSNAWLRLNLLPSDTASMLTPYWRAGRFSGVLPVANGGTGSIQFLNQSIPYSNGSILTFDKNKLNFDLSVSRLNVNIDTLSSFTGGASLRVGGGISGVGNYYLENGQQNFRVDGATYWQVGSMVVNGSALNFQIRNANFGLPIFYAQMTSPRNVGIRTTSLQNGFELTIADSVYVGGRVSAASYTTRSDFNLKDEIQNLNYGLNEIMQLLPVKYKLKSNGENKIGFIAQDVVSVLNEAVHFDENMSIEYSAIIAVLTKAIQEQQALIKALEQRIINLENK